MKPTIEITPLSKADIPGAVECIQLAFAEDPYFQWVFDTTRFDPGRNRASLTARCLWGMSCALFYVAKERQSSDDNDDQASVLGVSCWIPPQPTNQRRSWKTYFHDALLWLRQLRNNVLYLGRGGLRTRRYRLWKNHQREVQRELWTDPQGYYFCNLVAVRPDAQGRGIGRMLIDVVTQKADREGRRCYLESSREVPNVGIYQRMGFEMVRTMVCEEEGDECKLYCMIREPEIKGSVE